MQRSRASRPPAAGRAAGQQRHAGSSHGRQAAAAAEPHRPAEDEDEDEADEADEDEDEPDEPTTDRQTDSHAPTISRNQPAAATDAAMLEDRCSRPEDRQTKTDIDKSHSRPDERRPADEPDDQPRPTRPTTSRAQQQPPPPPLEEDSHQQPPE